MKRRGQFLSLDALLSIALVIMVIGVVINTNDMIKAEVSSMIGWYDRANIADNMLDVLTKSPGYPENWEDNPSSVKSVGLRSENYSYALSHEKITALNASINDVNVKESLGNFSRWKDFQMEFYLLTKNVSVGGSFPGPLITWDLSQDSGNFRISGAGNSPFDVECDSVLLNEEPAPYGNNIQLNAGDVLEFIPLEDIDVYRQNTYYGSISSNSHVVVEVISAGSNLKYTFSSSCTLHITGIGQVRVVVKSYDIGNLIINATSLYPSNITIPTYSFTLINGSLVTSNSTINSSKARSPWVEYEQRNFVVSTLIYNRSLTISQNETKILMEGKLRENVPEYAYIEIEVPSNEAGDVKIVAIDGSTIRGVLIRKDASSSNVTGVVAWKEGNKTFAKFYEGNTSSVRIPWKDIFERFNTENGAKPIELWIYEKSFSGNIVLRDLDNLGMLLEPKFEPVLIKLWVWDDR